MRIAFQGLPGAYSHAAARALYPSGNHLPYPSFEETLGAVENIAADVAIIPMENAIAGRVAELQLLLLNTKLFIVAEHFHPIEHCLVALPDTKKSDIQFVHSHVQALAQCRQNLRGMHVQTMASPNTAMAAAEIAARGDKNHAALSSALAADHYGLKVLQHDMADQPNNVTRFIAMARDAQSHRAGTENLMTSFVFRVRNIPAALYKALGGFATNGINMLKLESYIQDSSFVAADFYAEIDGHPDAPLAKLAFDELKFFVESHRLLGCYAKHAHRHSS
jgi:prephenate dehydratase